MSADVLAAVMAAISEWQSTEGAIEVAAYEREEFDADIRDAVMGEGDLERLQRGGREVPHARGRPDRLPRDGDRVMSLGREIVESELVTITWTHAGQSSTTAAVKVKEVFPGIDGRVAVVLVLDEAAAVTELPPWDTAELVKRRDA